MPRYWRVSEPADMVVTECTECDGTGIATKAARFEVLRMDDQTRQVKTVRPGEPCFQCCGRGWTSVARQTVSEDMVGPAPGTLAN